MIFLVLSSVSFHPYISHSFGQNHEFYPGCFHRPLLVRYRSSFATHGSYRSYVSVSRLYADGHNRQQWKDLRDLISLEHRISVWRFNLHNPICDGRPGGPGCSTREARDPSLIYSLWSSCMILISATLGQHLQISTEATRYSNGLWKVKPHKDGDFNSLACLLKWFEFSLGICCNHDSIIAGTKKQQGRRCLHSFT